ncbi:MAG TPA: hypothetical protein VGN28_14650 [Blastococcus sp.]|jgi:ABC-2 type transport system permease protein|nr:hypothetical protein [Blastococcus sp.]
MTERRAATVVAVRTGRRVWLPALVWGLVFGWLVFNEARNYAGDFPTAEARARFAATLGSNAGLAAIIGPARHIDTVGGSVAWRMFGLMFIVGGIWGLLTATRLMRGEEDAGRWELLLSGRTARRSATVQVLAGLAVGFLALWVPIAAFTVAAGRRADVGFPVSASLFYATAATAGAAMFMAVGALTSQLGSTRRQANALAAGVFGVAYLIRMVADAGTGLEWLRWASPLGWVENLAPLTGSNPLPLVPIVLVVGAASVGAVLLAGRRDVGVGVLARHAPPRGGTFPLGGPAGLAIRLERWIALAWIVGLGVLAVIFGITAVVAAEGNVAVADIQATVSRLGGQRGGAVGAWIGYEFLFIAALVIYAAAGQISALRAEEEEGHVDNLLARPVGRAHWLAGRLGFAVAMSALIGLATGVGAWWGLAIQGSDIGLWSMLQAGLNVVVPALFVVGLGTLLFGLVPRLARPILYAVVAWSVLVVVLGPSVVTNHWVLDTAVLTHVGPVPASALNWTAIGWMTGLALLAAVGGAAAFSRRDLASA